MPARYGEAVVMRKRPITNAIMEKKRNNFLEQIVKKIINLFPFLDSSNFYHGYLDARQV